MAINDIIVSVLRWRDTVCWSKPGQKPSRHHVSSQFWLDNGVWIIKHYFQNKYLLVCCFMLLYVPLETLHFILKCAVTITTVIKPNLDYRIVRSSAWNPPACWQKSRYKGHYRSLKIDVSQTTPAIYLHILRAHSNMDTEINYLQYSHVSPLRGCRSSFGHIQYACAWVDSYTPCSNINVRLYSDTFCYWFVHLSVAYSLSLLF